MSKRNEIPQYCKIISGKNKGNYAYIQSKTLDGDYYISIPQVGKYRNKETTIKQCNVEIIPPYQKLVKYCFDHGKKFSEEFPNLWTLTSKLSIPRKLYGN